MGFERFWFSATRNPDMAPKTLKTSANRAVVRPHWTPDSTLLFPGMSLGAGAGGPPSAFLSLSLFPSRMPNEQPLMLAFHLNPQLLKQADDHHEGATRSVHCRRPPGKTCHAWASAAILHIHPLCCADHPRVAWQQPRSRPFCTVAQREPTRAHLLASGIR